MQSGSASLTITCSIVDDLSFGTGNGFALNDLPTPQVASSTIPALSGYTWAAGSVFQLTFGVLSAQDSVWLASLHTTTGTLTLYVSSSGWRRISGTFSWASPTLTLTTTSLNIIEPWVTPI